jgi:preprotein translocase subunit YajC
MANHPLKHLGFEPAKDALARLGFEPADEVSAANSPHRNNQERPALKVRPLVSLTDCNSNDHSESPAAPRPTNLKTSVGGEKQLGELHKGSRVGLANGTQARVQYVDPNMRIVRVRTDEGRNITVRYKDLRNPDPTGEVHHRKGK